MRGEMLYAPVVGIMSDPCWLYSTKEHLPRFQSESVPEPIQVLFRTTFTISKNSQNQKTCRKPFLF